ncbi:MAG: 4'-phosphopantetheinyl transferase family protein [Geminicoccaceae bacterium]
MRGPIDDLFPLVHRSAGVSVHGVDLRPDRAVEAACLALLDEEEQARAARFAVAEPRRQFVITRGALRLLLASHLARPAQALTFATGPHGKPFALVDGAPSGVQFNVSHSAGRGLIAIARGPVGVDIEFLGREADFHLVAKGVLTAAELAALQRKAGAERTLLFYRLWTQKEALIKAKGTGFACPPRGFAVPPALIEGASCATFSFPGETTPWLVTDLSEGAYAAALAHAPP